MEGKKFSDKMKELGGCAAKLFIVALILCGLGGCWYLDYSAYRQRFPQASWWTYFFRDSK